MRFQILIQAMRCFSLGKAHLYPMLGLISLGVMSRLLPHPPNFTALNAIALFGISILGNLSRSLSTLFFILLFSDSFFGFHSSMIFVYLSFGSIVLMGYALRSKKSLIQSSFLLVLASLLFFFITNFGVWLVGSFYPNTLAGLGMCYIAAIPFLANNLISTIVYGLMIVFFSKAMAKVPERRLQVGQVS